MASKTLYDILEVSTSASLETIRAAYERLSTINDPASESNASNKDARFQYEAIKDAFFTLSNPEKRALYDKKLAARSDTGVRHVEVIDSFWTTPKLIVIGVIVLGLGGFYYKHQQEQSRLEAQKVIAAAQAKEAEGKAKAETETARIALQREREQKAEERRSYNEQRSAVQQYKGDVRTDAIINRGLANNDRALERSAAAAQQAEETRRKREENQAAAAARQSLARDKAELCRMERDRYGRSISC